MKRHNLKREKTCMVGDRLDTDILFGQNGNLKTLVVFTGEYNLVFKLNLSKGVAKPEDLTDPNNKIHPEFSINSLGDLHSLFK